MVARSILATLAIVASLYPAADASRNCTTPLPDEMLNLPQVKGDYPGHDLGNAPAFDAVACSYQCEQTDKCEAYSWSNYNGGTWWMKTDRAAGMAAPFDGPVVSGEVFKCKPFDKDHDIVGEDLAAVPRADWKQCCRVCRETNGCVGSSWNNYNGGTCWLKKTFLDIKKASGVMSLTLSEVTLCI